MTSPASVVRQSPLYTAPFFEANLVNLLALSSFNLFTLFPLYLQRAGHTPSTIGLILGFIAVTSIMVRPAVGHWLDRHGRRQAIIWGQVILALACVGMTLVPPTLVWMLLLRALQGVGFAVYFTAIFTWVADTAPTGRLGEAIGVFGLSGLIAQGIGPAVGDYVMHHWGDPALFWTGGVLLVCSTLVSLNLKESHHHPDAQAPHNATSALALIWQRSLLPVWIAAVLFGAGISALYGFMAPYVKQLSLNDIGSYFIWYNVAAILTRVFTRRLTDRVGGGAIIPAALAVLGVGVAGPAFVHQQWALSLTGILAGAGHGLIYPAMNALAVERAPARQRGSVMGFFMAGTELGGFLGALGFGMMAEHWGYRTGFLVTGAAVLCGVLLFRILETALPQGVPARPVEPPGYGCEANPGGS